MKNGIDGSVIKSVAFKKASSAAWKILRFLILLCIGFALVYPFLYMISSTFRGEEDIWNPTIVWITRHYTLGNLKATMVNMNYSSSLVFSLQISVVTALLQCFMCAFAGYSFARYDFKLKGLLFGIVILTIIVPQQMYIIQLFQIVKNLGLTDSAGAYWIQALFGVGIRSGLFIYIYRQNFRALPTDLEHAAAIDGCGAFGTYFKVMLPNALNSFVVVFLFSFIWHWNEYFSAEIFTVHKRNIPQALYTLRTLLSAQLGGTSQAVAVTNPMELQVWVEAGALLSVLPVLIVFFLGQKFLREGISRTGIVG